MTRYKVLKFISEFLEQRGYAPTYAEIAAAVGKNSLSTIHKHVHHLEKEGLIVLRPGARNMSMRLTICPKCRHSFQRYP